MTSSNRLQVGVVRESVFGTTPTTPRMRLKRLTGEALAFNPEYLDSDEIRSDRMNADPMLIMQSSGGTISDELSYPDDESPDSDFYRSLFYSTWLNTPQRFNDGTADSVITDVATTGVITVTTGTAFAIGHLIRLTGFGVPANNQIARVTVGSATVPSVGAALLTAEPAPAAAARVKVVGLQGAAGDLVAVADGITSTALDFTTMGLVVGQSVKIGGTADITQFAFLVTAGLTDSTIRGKAWARVTVIAAGKLTLDNLPTGWTTDAGTAKTIRLFFGDTIKNGTTRTGVTIERGFLGQTVPVYIVNRGMLAAQCQHTITSRQKVTRQWTFMGMGGGQSTTALDASPDAQTLGRVMAAHANVGRLSENGARLVAPNWAQAFNFTINNNLRAVEDIQETSPQGFNEGEFTVTGQLNAYFGDNSLLAKFYAGTPTSISSRIQKDGQAVIYQFPRVTYRGGGNPSAGGKNQDVMIPLDFQSSIDTLTSSQCMMDRLEYYEA